MITYKDVIEDKLKNVIKLSEEIQDVLTDEEFQGDFDKYADVEVSIRADLLSLSTFIEEKRKKNTVKKASSTVEKSNGRVKLPRFEIKKFSGDPTGWMSFIESFDAAVHSNVDLTDIEKMNFLVNHVEGEAENVIKGLLLSNDNYSVAKKMLHDRYGDPQMLITAHMAKLLSLDTIDDISDIKGLRRLYNEVETQVRSLASLKLTSHQYGPMLTPVLLQKLPSEFQLIISRKFGKSLWDIERILEFYNIELEAREKINFEKLAINEPDNITTGSALVAGISQNRSGNRRLNHQSTSVSSPWSPAPPRRPGDVRNIQQNRGGEGRHPCIFCGRNTHETRSCSNVTKPDVRKAILYKEKRCFKCFKGSHSAVDCWRDIKCFKCQGSHHTSICIRRNQQQPGPTTSERNIPSNASMVNLSEQNSVLLQTATAQVISTNARYSKMFRLFFDIGSQMSYITPKARDQLKLPTLRKHHQITKTFGNSQEKKVYDVVNFAVKSLGEGLNIYVTALVGDICLPIEGQQIDVAKETDDHLKDLSLADSNPGAQPLEIDILIGANHYDSFVHGKKIQGRLGPVAVESKLGYMLRGNMDAAVPSHSSIVSVHTLLVETPGSNHRHEDVKKDVKKVLDVESSQFNINDVKVYKHFQNSTKFINGRYQVELPFKDKDEVLGDNYKIARARLKSLYMSEFKDNPKLLREYDGIIREQRNNGIVSDANVFNESRIGRVYYMPHRPVVRADKSTTKVRMVFDASSSAKKSQALSLNDYFCFLDHL